MYFTMIGNILKWTRQRSLLTSHFYSTQIIKNNKNTIDSKEMDFFKSVSEKWWDAKGILVLLHNYNKVRVPFIVNSIKERGMCDPVYKNSSTPLKDISIMDVGCGGGILSESLAELGASVTGVDVNEDLYNVAVNHANHNKKIKTKIEYILADIENIKETHKDKYDVVISSECVEHVPLEYQDKFIKNCVQFAKPGGSIIVTTMNKTFKCWFLGIIVAENITKTIVKGAHEYKKFVTPDRLKTILKNNNCEPQVVHGFYCNFLNATFEYQGDDKCFYGIHAIKNI